MAFTMKLPHVNGYYKETTDPDAINPQNIYTSRYGVVCNTAKQNKT